MTLSTLISVRTIVKSRTSLLAGRRICSVMESPGLPLSAVMASESCIFSVVAPLILRIWSPLTSPALAAGVSSIADTTMSTPSLAETTSPRPS